ncbi:hypothetical protein OG741_37415 [Streptomyces sp. NBC_01410]|uniref:hypothetical protein n=1 Tax=Streptomyces sp. NBC_01410 TaxID=2903856 RepID=UPI00325424D6
MSELGTVGADEQLTALAERAVTHCSVADPDAMPGCWKACACPGAEEQITALVQRVLAHFTLDSEGAARLLLDELHEASANEQITNLTEQLPAKGHFEQFILLGDHSYGPPSCGPC